MPASLVLADTVNAETGIRGYAAVRDPLFLAPYNLTLTRIGADRRFVARSGGRRRRRPPAAGGGRDHGQGARRASPATFCRRPWCLRRAAPSGARAAENDHGPAAPPGRQPRRRAHRRVSRSAQQGRQAAASIDVLDVAGLALGLLAGLAGIALFTSGIASRVARERGERGPAGRGTAARTCCPGG